VRSVCGEPGCDEVVISSVDGGQWWHKPAPNETLADARWRAAPLPHRARPGHTIEHTCEQPDPACPGKGCGRVAHRKWLATMDAKRHRHDEWPMPGLIGRAR
jgi:hypothetical protein